jgi:hypothetical protein
MKKIFCLLAILGSLNSFGQRETDEDFINQIYPSIVDSDSTSYYLYTKADSLYLLDSSLIDCTKNQIITSGKMTEAELKQLIAYAFTKRRSGFWDFAKLKNAKPFNSDSIRVLSYFRNRWFAQSGYSKKQRKRVEEYNKREQDSSHITQHSLYYFSYPVFDSNYKFALIYGGSGDGYIIGESCIYIFEKKNNKWVFLSFLYCGVS